MTVITQNRFSDLSLYSNLTHIHYSDLLNDKVTCHLQFSRAIGGCIYFPLLFVILIFILLHNGSDGNYEINKLLI